MAVSTPVLADTATDVVAEGATVLETVEAGWSTPPGGLVTSAPPLKTVDWDGDGDLEVLSYKGERGIIQDEGLQTVFQAPGDSTGYAGVADVTGDGHNDLVVANEVRLRSVDGASGIVVGEVGYALPEHATIEDVLVVSDAPGGPVAYVVADHDAPATDQRKDGFIVAIELTTHQIAWTAVTPGAPNVRAADATGLLVAGYGWCGCPAPYIFTHVSPDGELTWVRDGDQYLLLAGPVKLAESSEWALAGGLLDADRAWVFDGTRAVLVLDRSDGSVLAEHHLVEGSTNGNANGRWYGAAAGDIDGDGIADYVFGSADFTTNGNPPAGLLSYHNNVLTARVWRVDGATGENTLLGQLDGLPRHLDLGDLDGDGILDIAAATMMEATPTVSTMNAAVTATVNTVTAWSGADNTLLWQDVVTGDTVHGNQYLYHRGLVVADVAPGGNPAVVTGQAWHGLVTARDGPTGRVVAEDERPGGAFEADPGPCGLVAATITGHVVVPGGFARTPTAAYGVSAAPDCGAYAISSRAVHRVSAGGELLWTHPLSEAPTDVLALADGGAIVGADDGLLQAFDEDGTRRWVIPYALHGRGLQVSLAETPEGVVLATCALNTPGLVALLDTATGVPLWLDTLSGIDCARLPIVDGDQIVVNIAGDAVAYDLATGDRRWVVDGTDPWSLHDLQDGRFAITTTLPDAVKLIVFDRDGNVLHDAPLGGSERWLSGHVKAVVDWGTDGLAWIVADWSLSQMELRNLDGGLIASLPVGIVVHPQVDWNFGNPFGLGESGDCRTTPEGVLCWGGHGQASAIHAAPPT